MIGREIGMYSVLIVSQGHLAGELLAGGRKIAGNLPNFEALELAWEDDLDAARRKVRTAAERLAGEDGLLILVDMYGGTPCNASLSLLDPGRIEILTGVNLPMVVRLGCLTEQSRRLGEAAEWLQAKGQGSICRPSQMGRPAAATPCDPTPCEGTAA
jgi:mannose/fructose-specific phosphotransferase system component IIA